MVYEVLARKWRPQVFEDVIGQDHVTQTLTNAIKTGRLAHAYLFGGPRGVGKTSVARIFAKAINCEQGIPGDPCNRCPSCTEITAGSAVDVQEIDGASNRGIDEIRELRDNIKYMPSACRYRIFIIDEVHMLTLPAFNALLKTLEEPPDHVKFIFATTETHKVPMTILSRCQRFDFKRIPLAKMISHLERIADEEKIQIGRSGLGLIAREAEGSMRDAESLLDQVISFAGLEVEDASIVEILGIVDWQLVHETVEAIIEGAGNRCLEIIDRIYSSGYDIREFYRALTGQFRNLVVSLVVPEDQLLDLTENEKGMTSRLAKRVGLEKLQVMLSFLINREENLRFTTVPRFVLESILIKLCNLGEFLSFKDLLCKVEDLERRLSGISSWDESSASAFSGNVTRKPALDGQKIAEPEATEKKGKKKDWQGFLSFLSSRNKPMHGILKHWRLLRRDDDSLDIAHDNHSFSSGYFEDRQKYDQLVVYCQEFFEKDINIRIVNSSQPDGPAPQGKRAASGRPEPDSHGPLPGPVQDVLQIFQGELKDSETGEK
jgi:DNA polymerase-3 subunit gamma/tau